MSQNIADMVPFAKMMGMKITPTSKDKIDGTMTVRPDQCTTMGGLHGGAVMSFADSLGATGAFINLPEGAAGTTTLARTREQRSDRRLHPPTQRPPHLRLANNAHPRRRQDGGSSYADADLSVGYTSGLKRPK